MQRIWQKILNIQQEKIIKFAVIKTVYRKQYLSSYSAILYQYRNQLKGFIFLYI